MGKVWYYVWLSGLGSINSIETLPHFIFSSTQTLLQGMVSFYKAIVVEPVRRINTPRLVIRDAKCRVFIARVVRGQVAKTNPKA